VTDSPFSADEINAHVDRVMAKDGNTFDVGFDTADARPALTFEAQGELKRMTWAAWARTQFSKVSTAVGAKVGFRW
jgi:hypothetical protein